MTVNTGASSSSSPIECLVKDVIDKEKRKCNVILLNVLDTDSFCENKSYLSKLINDFGLDKNTIEAISHIGRILATRPRPIHVQFGSAWCATALIEAAYQLRFMKCTYSNLSISPDRPSEEIKLLHILMKELKCHRDDGEHLCLLCHKIEPVFR